MLGGPLWTTSGWQKSIALETDGSAISLNTGTQKWGIGGSGEHLYFFTTTADDNSAAPDYKMFINGTSGNVGFNTIAPSASVHIVKPAAASEPALKLQTLQTGDGVFTEIEFANSAGLVDSRISAEHLDVGLSTLRLSAAAIAISPNTGALRLAIGGAVAGEVLSTVNDQGLAEWVAPGIMPQRTVTASTTATGADYAIYCNATSGNITVTIPLASSMPGRILVVKKLDGSGNTVGIARSGSDLIDGQMSYSGTPQYRTFTVQSDGVSTWHIIGYFTGVI